MAGEINGITDFEEGLLTPVGQEYAEDIFNEYIKNLDFDVVLSSSSEYIMQSSSNATKYELSSSSIQIITTVVTKVSSSSIATIISPIIVSSSETISLSSSSKGITILFSSVSKPIISSSSTYVKSSSSNKIEEKSSSSSEKVIMTSSSNGKISVEPDDEISIDIPNTNLNVDSYSIIGPSVVKFNTGKTCTKIMLFGNANWGDNSFNVKVNDEEGYNCYYNATKSLSNPQSYIEINVPEGCTITKFYIDGCK